MKTQQIKFTGSDWKPIQTQDGFYANHAQLVLVFGERTIFESVDTYGYLRTLYSKAQIVYSSTAGEIYENSVHDNSIIVTAIDFERTEIQVSVQKIESHIESHEVGIKLAENLNNENLKSVFIISDGGLVNGSELIKGLESALDVKVSISGGLAGDQARFEKTVVGLNQNPSSGNIVAIGFYGEHIKIGHGTMGGWELFGPEREITKSAYNVVYEIGNKSALQLYKEYLGKYASELPSAALLFPLALKIEETNETVVRTILSINEEDQSMTFAGEMPTGSIIRFMKANFDKLISASEEAAFQTKEGENKTPELAVLVSCVGRKLVLGERIDEEIEAVRAVFGDTSILTGFYSYGEISPHVTQAKCDLHNQTMTITTFSEK